MIRATHADRTLTFGAYFDCGAGGSVTEARMLVGGAGDALFIPTKTVSAIVGKEFTEATFKAASTALLEEIRANPSTSAIHTAAYRESLAMGLLYKSFLAAQEHLPATMASAIV